MKPTKSSSRSRTDPQSGGSARGERILLLIAGRTVAQEILHAAIQYADRGWKVLPLRAGGKIPILKKWQENASCDSDTIERWWTETPGANVGVQLGPRSGIIDIEYDTDEGRETAARLFSDCFTPSYSTGGRSVHRLFLWNGDLPDVQKVEVAGLEIRIGGDDKGAQSVFPPSLHPSGKTYTWLEGLSPDQVELMEVPDSVVLLLANNPAMEAVSLQARDPEHWKRIFGGTIEGGRNDDITSYIGKMLSIATTDALHDEKEIRTLYWSCLAINGNFRPPLDEKEVRTAFESILKREQRRRIARESEELMKPPVASQIDSAVQKQDKRQSEWRLVIVRSEPPTYRLYAPQFAKADGGYIRLNIDQITSAAAIRKQALWQADYPLAMSFIKVWNAKDGLYERLVHSAEEIDAEPEQKRPVVLAELLNDFLRKRKELAEGQIPDRRTPSVLPNGDIIFQFKNLYEALNTAERDVSRDELSRLLARLGAKRYESCDRRFKRLDADAQKILDQLLRA